jgi:hypothetical protein
MKTYTTYESLPKNTIYLGSENGDGSVFEELDTLINEALNPVIYRDEDGIKMADNQIAKWQLIVWLVICGIIIYKMIHT